MSSILTTRVPSILLVEDDEADALLIREALFRAGVERSVAQVTDGVKALAYLRDPARPRPDLIVLDLNMPRMGGRELLAILKSDEELRVVPAVILTTSEAPEDITGAYERHANAYVTKPVTLEEFNAAVRSIDAFFLDTVRLPPRENSQNWLKVPHGTQKFDDRRDLLIGDLLDPAHVLSDPEFRQTLKLNQSPGLILDAVLSPQSAGNR